MRLDDRSCTTDINPDDCNEISTSGPYNVTIWHLEGRSLICHDLIQIENK